MVILDTSILISALKGDSKAIAAIESYKGREQMGITVMNKYELMRGAGFLAAGIIDALISSMLVYDLNDSGTGAAVEVYASLKKKGKMINEFDVLIAGIALANEQAIVTMDGDFQKVSGLSVVLVK